MDYSFGAPVARALALARFEPACDRYTDIWFDETRLLIETRLRNRDESTRLRALHLDDVVRAVEAINAVDPLATGHLSGDDPGAGQPGDSVVGRLLRYNGSHFSGAMVTEEILFVGVPGRYGAVTRPLAPPVPLPPRRT